MKRIRYTKTESNFCSTFIDLISPCYRGWTLMSILYQACENTFAQMRAPPLRFTVARAVVATSIDPIVTSDRRLLRRFDAQVVYLDRTSQDNCLYKRKELQIIS